MKVYLVRHGLTQSNLNNVYAGRSMEPLLSEGYWEVAQAAQILAKSGVGGVYYSPLLRTIETAEAIAAAARTTTTVSSSLNEHNLGLWSGRSGDEISNRWPAVWDIWRSDPFQVGSACEMEPLRDVQRRALQWLSAVDTSGPDIAAVTHESVIKCLLCAFDPGRDLAYRQFNVANGSVHVLELTHDTWWVYPEYFNPSR